MSTTIYLYKCAISRNRNCRIDDINAFLSSQSKASKSYNNCGYVAIDYRIGISLSLSQTEVGKPSYNYCRINQDNRDYYFFINKANWVSKNSVNFTLTLDTINTFWGDFKWSQKTTIVREHRDRWTKSYRIIDRFNEGLNPALDQLSTPKEVPTKTNAFNNYGKCYLVWLANAEITPEKQSATPLIPCLLTETKYQFSSSETYSNTSFEMRSHLAIGESLFITDSVNQNASFIWSSGSVSCNFGKDTDDGATLRAIRIKCTADNTYTFERIYYTGDKYPYSFKKKETRTLDLGPTISVVSGSGLNYGYKVKTTDFIDSLTNLVQIDAFEPYYISIGTTNALNVEGFNSFDRSSTYISSIIQIPYAPVALESSITGFIPGFNLLKLNEKTRLLRALVDDDFYKGDIAIDPPAAAYNSINKDYESKLYSSEFYQRVYSYGDDQEVIRYEFIGAPKYSLDITWQISSNMTNDFRFFFDLGNSYERMDIYNDYLFISESSQIPLYNSSYIDYIRNGYNYDSYVNKKNNQLSVINAIGNGLSTGVSLIGGGAVGPGIVAGRAIQYGLKGLSAAASIDSNNRQFQKIVNEKASTSPTVTGNSSIDLRPYNKLMVYTKSLREEVRNQIFWKFYYTGYSHPCQEIPDTTSRHWFNYLECYPVFKEEETSVYADYLDDIRGRFQEGVTVFHKVAGGSWNLEQDKENIEEALLK